MRAQGEKWGQRQGGSTTRGEKKSEKIKRGQNRAKKKKQERKNAGYFPQATPKNRGS